MTDPSLEIEDPTQGTALCGVFVIWPAGMGDAEQIVEDLGRRFQLLQLVEVNWSDHLVQRNYERFYSDLDVRGCYHELNKGRGPFVAVAVRDDRPVVDSRPTSRGTRLVSANFVDAKHEYRKELGNLAVHCGENQWESARDLTMLLGVTFRQITETTLIGAEPPTRSTHRDVTGAHGWTAPTEMFTVLNPIVPYVAIGDLTPEVQAAPTDPPNSTADPIMLLTPEVHTLHTVLNGRAVGGHPHRGGGQFLLTIGARSVPVDVRPVEDGLIDPGWARTCLDGRMLDRQGIYRAPPQDDLGVRAYLAVSRRRRLTETDRHLVQALAQAAAGPTEPTAGPGFDLGHLDHGAATAIVTRYLDRHGYRRITPVDRTVVIHHPDEPTPTRLGRQIRAAAVRVERWVVGHGSSLLWRARSVAVLKLPRLRALWRRWRYGR